MIEFVGATLVDVARAAGVSQSTASRVLNGSARAVLPENEERVRAAAHRLGYSVDLHAQATARRDSTMVAIVVDSLTDPESMEIAMGIHERAELNGYAVRVAVCRLASDDGVAVLRAVRGERPRGIFVIVPRDKTIHDALKAEVVEYQSQGGSVIVIDQAVRRDHCAESSGLWQYGRRLAARALAERSSSGRSDRNLKGRK
mgnify:FL=1